MKYVDLWDRKDSLVKEFSGGMKRRLEIARGLLHEPKILFLDEPTTGLDPQTRNLLWDRLQELNKTEKMTIFLTTHYMEEAERMATRIAIMDHGKIIATGTSEALKKQTNTEFLEARVSCAHGPAYPRGGCGSGGPHTRSMGRVWQGGGRRKQRQMKKIYYLWLRQIKKYLRSTPRLLGLMAQPIIFLVMFGYGFGSSFSQAVATTSIISLPASSA